MKDIFHSVVFTKITITTVSSVSVMGQIFSHSPSLFISSYRYYNHRISEQLSYLLIIDGNKITDHNIWTPQTFGIY